VALVVLVTVVVTSTSSMYGVTTKKNKQQPLIINLPCGSAAWGGFLFQDMK
jgi:hypothetical protein